MISFYLSLRKTSQQTKKSATGRLVQKSVFTMHIILSWSRTQALPRLRILHTVAWKSFRNRSSRISSRILTSLLRFVNSLVIEKSVYIPSISDFNIKVANSDDQNKTIASPIRITLPNNILTARNPFFNGKVYNIIIWSDTAKYLGQCWDRWHDIVYLDKR